jgi:hypothetical protein
LEWLDGLLQLQKKLVEDVREPYVDFITMGKEASQSELNEAASKWASVLIRRRAAIAEHLAEHNITSDSLPLYVPDYQEGGLTKLNYMLRFVGLPINLVRCSNSLAVIDENKKEVINLNARWDRERTAEHVEVFGKQGHFMDIWTRDISYVAHKEMLERGDSNYRKDYVYLRIPRGTSPKEITNMINEIPNDSLRYALGSDDSKRSPKLIPNFPILLAVKRAMRNELNDEKISEKINKDYFLHAYPQDIVEKYKRSIQLIK